MNYDTTTSRRRAEAADFDAAVMRARLQVEAEFRLHTDHAGEIRHHINPPLEVEEALDPLLDSAAWIVPSPGR